MCFNQCADKCVPFPCRALLYNHSQIPEVRKDELEQIVKNFFGLEKLSEEILKSGVELDTKYAFNMMGLCRASILNIRS